MKKPSDQQDLDSLRDILIGLGERSFRKSYYPELQDRLEQLERFRALLDQSTDAIFLVQLPGGNLIDVNESVCEQTGYSRKELLTMSVSHMFDPQQTSLLADMFLSASTIGPEPTTIATVLKKRSTDQIPVEITLRMVAFDNTSYVVAVARDISQRKTAEEEIRRQNQELQAAYQELTASYEEIEALTGELEESNHHLIETNAELALFKERLELAIWGARVGMWDWYISTGELHFNERYADIHGFGYHELSWKLDDWKSQINADDWPEVKNRLFSHVEGKTPYFEAEYRIMNKKRDWIWIHDSGKVVCRDDRGRAVRAAGIIQEITGRKQVEQSLATSQAMYQGIFNATSNPIFLVDIDDLSILEANPAAQHLFDYTLEELKRMDLAMLNYREYDEACGVLKKEISKARQAGISTRRGQAKKKNGEKIPVWAYFNLVSINELDRILVVFYDLSEEMGYQQEREKATRYEAQAMKMTTLSLMSAGVVHEISQPLNAIKVLADGMLFWQEKGRPVDIGKTFDTFNKISEQADRINEIIRHMRNLANASEDNADSHSDINAALTGTMHMLGRQLAVHGVKVQLDLVAEIPPVPGQEEHLEEVVINLIVNAMRALDEKGREEKMIVCRTRREKARVILEIADNGPGISPELSLKIWEPFFTTNEEKGMGLGLVLVQSIVSRLGGNITHYNNEWGGATFRVELPHT